jgi:hypothetical protein
MRKTALIPSIFVLVVAFLLSGAVPVNAQQQNEVRFVSSPDFFNFDVPDPRPRWDKAVDWYLDLVKSENPDLFLVAGDTVDGRWYNGPKTVEHMGLVYYEAWERRMKRHNLNYAVAIGDHEIGDDPGMNKKPRLAPKFKEVFAKYLNIPGKRMPVENNELVSYYNVIGNVLFITVDTYELRDGKIHQSVTGEQLKWVRNVLNEHAPETDFTVVQGHTPIVGNPKATNSSKHMLNNGRTSKFWQLMKKAGVDLYLCGEFHALTTNNTDGIWQIVHGTSWGRKGNKQTYLVGKSTPNRLDLTIRQFPFDVQGEKTWNLNKGTGGPYQIVEIPQSVRKNGPETVGTITIKKKGDQEKQVNATGVFE